MQKTALLLTLALIGCASAQRRYPSLLPRATEARGWTDPAPPASAPVTADPALDAELVKQSDALATSDADFQKALTRAAMLTAAARGDAAGGERWIAAQSALAELDAHRAATSDAAGSLEQTALDRAAALRPDYPPLEIARAKASAQLEAETARIAELQAMLPQA